MSNFTPPAECPVCGEAVPQGARACPGCGADERSGWDEAATHYDGLDLPDSAFVDGNGSEPTPGKAKDRFWLVVAGLLLLALVATFVFR